MDQYIPVSKVAALIGVTRSAVDIWCRDGLVKARRQAPLANWEIELDSLIDRIYANPKNLAYMRDLELRGNSTKLRDYILEVIDQRPKLMDLRDVEYEYGILPETLRYWVQKGILTYAPYRPTYAKLCVYAEDVERAMEQWETMRYRR